VPALQRGEQKSADQYGFLLLGLRIAGKVTIGGLAERMIRLQDFQAAGPRKSWWVEEP
jgi:hypothetical protein